ncbi:MAG: glycerate kinase [Granulosicoccus sp.]
MNREDRKAVLHRLFQAGVDAVGGQQATARELSKRQFDKPLHLVAVGKAADAMAMGAIEVLDDKLVSGLVLTKHQHLSDPVRLHPKLECHESGHPVPDENSLKSGVRLCQFVAAIPADHQLLFLVSGGASALVEHLDEGLSLEDLKRKTDQLLASGAAIGEMNRHRRQISQIKGGKLAKFLHCQVLQLLISDVPGDKPQDIGSGLLVPDETTGMPAELPVWAMIETQIIASSAIAQAAVNDAVEAEGLLVRQASGSLDGDVAEVRDRIASVVATPDCPSGVYIWGGEPTVQLPEAPGRGGRNQHLALSLADAAAINGKVSLLVCGTDGSDGPTADAGGLVDEQTTTLASQASLSIDDYLQNADAGNCLEALGLLVTTGPTGTNVMDLAIVIVS